MLETLEFPATLSTFWRSDLHQCCRTPFTLSLDSILRSSCAISRLTHRYVLVVHVHVFFAGCNKSVTLWGTAELSILEKVRESRKWLILNCVSANLTSAYLRVIRKQLCASAASDLCDRTGGLTGSNSIGRSGTFKQKLCARCNWVGFPYSLVTFVLAQPPSTPILRRCKTPGASVSFFSPRIHVCLNQG